MFGEFGQSEIEDLGQEGSVPFLVKEDVSGTQTFNIEVLTDNENPIQQPVSVVITEKSAGFLLGGFVDQDNWYVWGIGLLNLILIIVIIVVAIRVARK